MQASKSPSDQRKSRTMATQHGQILQERPKISRTRCGKVAKLGGVGPDTYGLFLLLEWRPGLFDLFHLLMEAFEQPPAVPDRSQSNARLNSDTGCLRNYALVCAYATHFLIVACKTRDRCLRPTL